MKIYLLLIPIILTMKGRAQVNDILEFERKVLYNFSFQPDSTDPGIKRTILTELFVNDSIAVFQSEKKTKQDSALYHNHKPIGAISIYVGDINPTNFQIIQTNEVITTFEPLNGLGLSLNDELYRYEEKAGEPTWRLSSDTMRIHNIQCQKAHLDWEGRKWIVWFAPSIPISFGPYKFKGLPGLVVRAYDEQHYFVFDLVTIQSGLATVIPANTYNGLNMVCSSKQAFYRSRKKFRENMYEIAIAAGARPEELNKVFIDSVQVHDNNHIEKY